MSNPFRVEVPGPLSMFAAGFLDDLLRRGYRPGTAAKQLQAMSHLSRWIAARDVGSSDLTQPVLEEFIGDRRASGQTHVVSLKGLGPLIDYVQRAGLVTTGAPAAPGRTFQPTFHAVLRAAGLEPAPPPAHPRAHDLRHSFANGRLEALNSRIRLISHRAHGFHSPEALIAMVYLCCAGIHIDLPHR